MTQRQDRTSLAAVFLLPAVVIGYAGVIVLGFLWPEEPMVAIVASIVVSLVVLVGSVAWFRRRTRWWLTVCLVLLAVVLVLPMIGAASLGTNMALESRADRVSGRVVDIDVEQVSHRRGAESYRTTYTFVAADDGRELGTLEYRGDRDAHGFGTGDQAEVLADPSGELPLKLVEDVDSARDIGMIVTGGVLYLIGFVVGLIWPALRARF